MCVLSPETLRKRSSGEDLDLDDPCFGCGDPAESTVLREKGIMKHFVMGEVEKDGT